ncbi:hypothetical protein HPB49_024404 [Dermacentor silvarum]|uniref:Uncharacterized protein n=1 Tax=Dermacentor silvarum TaxID=543639 RepID=A0ACB8CTK4_DERSI|nr:hypothetical protein HPB49_024404 [Dermacentor silvarum]
MERPTMRGTPWSTPTIEKGLKIRLTCGRRGYNIVQEIGTPLPSERTLQRHLENFKFSPGILHEILPSLSIKVDLMEDYERHAVLLLDEMQLASGLAYDQGTGGVIGKPTIPLSDGTLPEDAMATHDCHNIANKLLKVYLKTRLQIHLRKENQRLAEIKSTVKCGSRSIGKQSLGSGTQKRDEKLEVPSTPVEAAQEADILGVPDSRTHEVFQSHFCDYFVYTHVLPYQNDILAYDSNQSWERFKKASAFSKGQ